MSTLAKLLTIISITGDRRPSLPVRSPSELYPIGQSDGRTLFQISHLITVHQPGDGAPQWVVISAFCPICSGRRGAPKLGPRRINGVDTWMHQWENACGHPDTNDSILAEIANQCAHRNCAIMQSEIFAPYCCAQCAVRSAWNAVSEIRGAVESLTEPLITLVRLGSILESCPFEEASTMTESVDDLTKTIAKLQRKLANQTAVTVLEATNFFGELDRLVATAGADTLHPQWSTLSGRYT